MLMSPAELCILFIHHTDDAVTQNHLALMEKLNPGTPVVPLAFTKGLTHAKLMPNIVLPAKAANQEPHGNFNSQWFHLDRLLYEWFLSPDRIEADRYLLLEWDTFCTVPAKEFYKPCWDKPAAGAQIHQFSNAGWTWFQSFDWRKRYGKHLNGISPTCGVMFSHKALNDVATLAKDPAHHDLFCETRLGTMLSMTGHQPSVIFPGVSKYIACVWRKPRGDGIWHSVKTFPHE